MLRRKDEEPYNNCYSNENKIYRVGKLKRKMKNCDLNNIPNRNYMLNNNDYTNYNNYPEYNKRNSNNLMKENYSTNVNTNKNNIYTYYQYKNKNSNYDYNNDYINNKCNKKANPIVRPSKSALPNKRNCEHSHHDNRQITNENKEFLLCQNCINSRLIEQKKRRNELNKKSFAGIYEDKYKNYSENLIKEKILQREKNINEIYNNYEKWNEFNDKDKLIKENENSVNPLYQDNHNYLYEKFLSNYEKKQKVINDNYSKFQNPERPGVASYYKNYVNNPNYRAMDYGEYRPKQYDIDNYRRDLDEQINFRNNKKRKEKEEDKLRENMQSKFALNNLENEKREKEMKKNKIKEELIKGNLELIQAKKRKNELLNKEEIKYRDYYNNDKMKYNNDLLQEKAKKDKMNKEFVMENQKNLSRIKRKKEELMLENEQYRYNDLSYEPPKEITAECSGCHRIYPKKLLTRNAYYFK